MDRNRALHETVDSLLHFTWSSWLSVLSDKKFLRTDLILLLIGRIGSPVTGRSSVYSAFQWTLAVKVHEIPRLCLNVNVVILDLQPSKPKALYYEKACWLNPKVMLKCQPIRDTFASAANLKHHITKKHVETLRLFWNVTNVVMDLHLSKPKAPY